MGRTYTIKKGLIGFAIADSGEKKKIMIVDVYPWIDVKEEFISVEITDEELEEIGYLIDDKGHKVVQEKELGLFLANDEKIGNRLGFTCLGLFCDKHKIVDEFVEGGIGKKSNYKYAVFE